MEPRKLSNHLRPGVELQTVVTPPSADGDQGVYSVGAWSVTRIYVVEETGPMSMLPWARVEFQDKPPVLINLQHVESVTFSVEHE